MIENTYLRPLFQNVQAAFDQSDIKQYALAQGRQWNYAIASTYLKKQSHLIVGFNWGVTKGEDYDAQETIPKHSFKDLYDLKWLGSLQRVYRPLEHYFSSEEVAQFIQTNFCFFRSETESQISGKDLELSTPPFEQLLGILEPKGIFCFSSKLRDHLIGKGNCTDLEEANFQSNTRTIYVVKGKYKTTSSEVPIYFLPHPNAKFTSEARRQAWEFCFA